jgi:UDP-N-acetylmuramate dehydrogenase
VVVADAGFPGVLVLVATRGMSVDQSACAGAYVTLAAGEPWDEFTATAVEREWVGVETLAGIPGKAGATPVQNVGAYGAEVAGVVAAVRTWDRAKNAVTTFAAADCGFGYRTSRFKGSDRYVILSVDLQLRLGPRSEPIRYAELATHLGVAQGDRAPLAAVRAAVLALRRSKGMVLDPADHDTWSAGSFFTNPLVTPDQAAQLPPEAPRFPQPDGRVKTSAAWLIDHAGFAKGFALGRAGISTRHVLALTNRGGATADEVVMLARRVRDGVEATVGVRLVPEPVFVGCEL